MANTSCSCSKHGYSSECICSSKSRCGKFSFTKVASPLPHLKPDFSHPSALPLTHGVHVQMKRWKGGMEMRTGLALCVLSCSGHGGEVLLTDHHYTQRHINKVVIGFTFVCCLFCPYKRVLLEVLSVRNYDHYTPEHRFPV